MQITFGIYLDGAEWSPDAASLGVIVGGPLQILQILEERLGLSGLQSSTPERINQYMHKIEAANPSWCRNSFAVDPWTTAQQLLFWRDELLLAGWTPEDGSPSQRLQTLFLLEQDSLPLAPGLPDRLRKVLQALDAVPCSDQVRLTEPLELLPWIWKEIFAALERNGATLLELEAAVTSAPEVTQVTGRDEATLATHLARYLTLGDNRSLALVCNGDSGMLDGILHRFGIGAVGAQTSSRWRESLQILPLFLETVWKPFQPQRFLELLLLTDSPFPAYIRRPLINALQKEPGIGGEEWEAAWIEASKTINENKHGYYQDAKAELAKLEQLREMLDKQSFQAEQKVDAELLIERCEFLQKRLNPQVEKTPGLGLALSHCKALIGILKGKTQISRVELARMLDSIIGDGSDGDRRAEVKAFYCVNHPAKLNADFDTVLWWNFIDSGKASRSSWSEEECKVLPGFNPYAARQLEHLSWTRGMRHARQRLIVFTPRFLAGDVVFPHPYLDELKVNCKADAETLCNASGHWSLADRSVDLLQEPLVDTPVPTPELAPATIAPLRRLSYTQMSSLLTCPFQWFLADYIGLCMPPAMNVPTSSQMYGSLAHKVVEKMIEEKKSWQPDEAEKRAGEYFDDLVGKMGAELLEDGQSVIRDRIRSTLCPAVKRMFEYFNDKGLTPIGTEYESSSKLDAHDFIGKIDILLQDASGNPHIIDMKWSSATYLKKDLDKGNALQLATYAWLLDPKDFAVNCQYFLFPSKQFLGKDNADWAELWQRAVETWHIRLRQMSEGSLERGFADEKELESKPLKEPLPLTKSATCNFCHFSTLCGREGDEA
jgi:ATP-dependent helicase/nuclease subunit B